MTITITEGSDKDILRPEVQVLIKQYAEECAIAGLPDPSYKFELYQSLYNMKLLRIVVAKTDEDQIVGFVCVLGSTLPHYGIPIATVESFFVGKQYRKTGAGIRLRIWAERIAREFNSPGLLICCPIDGSLDNYLSKCKDYRVTNKVYFKRLV